MTTRAAIEIKTKTSQMKIPFVNIAAQHAPLKEHLLKAMESVLDGGHFILGEEVQEFEKRFADCSGTRFAVGLNSGTDALILSLRVLGIGAGDEVITVPNSFAASTACICLVGAKPVFVDVDERYLMDPKQIEKVITSKTKAILPVHLTGRIADMNSILALAQKHRLHVVEDAAQAVLAEYHGKRAGSFGILGCFSLHPLKTLSALGDGGVITTQDEKMYQKLKVLRNIGLETRDLCVEWSGNSRLDTIQAASLLVKLDYLQDWTDKRRQNAKFYQKALAGISEIRCPTDRSFEKAVYHTFVILAEHRDALKDNLARHGIETAVHYPIPIHLQPAAANLGGREGSFPEAEHQARRILSLPIYPELSEYNLEYIADCIRNFYKP